MPEEKYKYVIGSNDTLWGLAKEYTKIKKGISIAEAEKAIKKLNPHLKILKVGQVIYLPFPKKSTTAPAPKTPYEKWQATINDAITNPAWDKYDAVIKSTVTAYNSRLGKTSHNVLKAMPSLNWLWIKAMVWVESGGPNGSVWNTRPMQIGNPGDPGYAAVKHEEGAAKIIMDGKLKAQLIHVNNPVVNIQIGITYLLSRLAQIEIRSTLNNIDKKEYVYAVVGGDSFHKIAKKMGTTVQELEKSNPTIKNAMLRPKMNLKYHKASLETVVVNWRHVTATTIYTRYNQGDPLYPKKLNYIMDEVVPKLQRSSEKK